MKKFIVVKTGREVKLGDDIVVHAHKRTEEEEFDFVSKTALTENLLNTFIKKGLIKVVELNRKEEEFKTNYKECFQSNLFEKTLKNIAEKAGWKVEKLDNILGRLYNVNPWGVIQFLLKELAIELDKKYPDHINDSKTIFAISPQDGRIHKIEKAHIKSYKAFPAFRTIEDAKVACGIVRCFLKDIFSNA